MGQETRYCLNGHHHIRTTLASRRAQMAQTVAPARNAESISCDGCGQEITDEYIAGSCKTCNMDFCETCFQSGRSIQEMIIAQSRQQQYIQQRLQQPIQACCMLAMVSRDTSGDGTTHVDIDPLTAAARGQRYNDRRPNYQDTGRVSYEDYPDPTQFGWRFTGSCEGGRAEFFEKVDLEDNGSSLIKLDFYYTTGTVKTVLDHPRQGVTQLFGKGGLSGLTPSLYRQILQNPRTHTNVRYHQK